MSNANPIKAVRALIPAPIATSCGCVVRPLTLGMFAVLERISSPMLGEKPADGTLSMLPSLYALTHEPADTLAPDLFARSLAWADTLAPAALVEIRDAAERQIKAMLDVVPEPNDVKKGSNGWIANLAQWCAETYGWSYEQILWGTPASAIALFRRQWAFGQGVNNVFPLSVIEDIDNGKEADS